MLRTQKNRSEAVCPPMLPGRQSRLPNLRQREDYRARSEGSQESCCNPPIEGHYREGPLGPLPLRLGDAVAVHVAAFAPAGRNTLGDDIEIDPPVVFQGADGGVQTVIAQSLGFEAV